MICDQDPRRRRPGKSTAGKKMTVGVCLNGRKYGQMAFQTRTDLQNQAIGWLRRDAVLLAVERWYDFPEFGGYLGNVG